VGTPVRLVKKDLREHEKTVPDLAACATLAEQDGGRGVDDELIRRFMELRRAYLAFEKLMTARGLELKS
jgi:hypothetical protein